MPAEADEQPLNLGGPFVQRVRLRKLLVEHEPAIWSGDAQRVRCWAAASVDLILELFSAPSQD